MLGSTKGVLGNDIHCLCKPKTWTSRRLPDSRWHFPVLPTVVFDIQRLVGKNVTNSRKRRLFLSDRILDGFYPDVYSRSCVAIEDSIRQEKTLQTLLSIR
jgi:hypothetical protein